MTKCNLKLKTVTLICAAPKEALRTITFCCFHSWAILTSLTLPPLHTGISNQSNFHIYSSFTLHSLLPPPSSSLIVISYLEMLWHLINTNSTIFSSYWGWGRVPMYLLYSKTPVFVPHLQSYLAFQHLAYNHCLTYLNINSIFHFLCSFLVLLVTSHDLTSASGMKTMFNAHCEGFGISKNFQLWKPFQC